MLAITRGHAEVLRIGDQKCPRLFDLHSVLPVMLYERVVDDAECVSAQGDVRVALDEERARELFTRA